MGKEKEAAENECVTGEPMREFLVPALKGLRIQWARRKQLPWAQDGIIKQGPQAQEHLFSRNSRDVHDGR